MNNLVGARCKKNDYPGTSKNVGTCQTGRDTAMLEASLQWLLHDCLESNRWLEEIFGINLAIRNK